MVLTWFSKAQKTARTRCPEDKIPKATLSFLKSYVPQTVMKNQWKTKWNKHVKIMVTLQKKKILIEALAITIQYPLQEAKVIQNPQSAFSPMQSQPESITSCNCFHWDDDIFEPTPLRRQQVRLIHKQLIHHLINQFTLVSNSYGASL